jgi:hypothetical protein
LGCGGCVLNAGVGIKHSIAFPNTGDKGPCRISPQKMKFSLQFVSVLNKLAVFLKPSVSTNNSQREDKISPKRRILSETTQLLGHDSVLPALNFWSP